MTGRTDGRIYPWVALAILTALYTAAFIDRQVLNLLVDPIKRSLQLSETGFSLLQGLAFMVSFSLLSPVAGRMVDRFSRRWLLAGAGVVWSVCTVLCGLADTFTMLFLARVGVGAAEAFVTPAGWALLADTFDRRRLPRALSLFLMGPYVGSGLALVFGGLLIQAAPTLPDTFPVLAALEPWQRVFVVIGVPGIALGLLALFLREPRRTSGGAPAEVPLREALRFIWERRRFYVLFSLGMAGVDMTLYALPAWMPAVLIRSFGSDPVRTGVEFGTVSLLAGMAGVLSGPTLSRLLEPRLGERANVAMPAIAAALLIPAGLLLLVVDSYAGGLSAAALATFLYTMPQATAGAALQIATPPGLRGFATALYAFTVSVVGLALAPMLVALLTDFAFADPAKVNLSLGIVVVVSSIGALWAAWAAIPHFREADASA